ncbi:LysE family transporter [Leptolyngbya sp. CCY15150]|uniref:LysE/ArgO family amino acid transporter n=1 Tax=Leptolyngbya sp. CCY15150 TaxID=2767772 RepID=UPI00194FEDA7|nr:LysE family transporter [Leptolyngbya sp. CCY15150]
MSDVLLRGIVIGLAIAAPVGPIGLLCIRRTLAAGRWAGLVSGMGAATADAIYGCIAGFGLTFISQMLIDQAIWLRLIGGLFLCYLGIKTIVTPAASQAAPVTHAGLAGMYVSTLALTITNPLTILSFVGIFAGLGMATAAQPGLEAAQLVFGVFLGSAMWWLILSSGANLLRGKLTQQLTWINRISGSILVVFGVIALNL